MSTWWKDAVLYQIYVRSFADSNGDGVGDLQGIIGKLDHLGWLGVDALWLSPIHPSPNADWGYDVADYLAVDPELGTLDDLDELVSEAARRDMRVVLDLVPNHTSDRHPWFREQPDRYVWADGKPDGAPPNNWVSSFGGPAWTRDPASGRWYLHHFLAEQPDLDWWNPEVRTSFEEILRFWFDRGIAGFRIDVCHMIVKDRELRDNPPATEDDPPFVRLLGQRLVHDSMQPEVHQVLRSWRRVADRYAPPRLLLGETYVFDLDDVASFYGNGDELHLALNIPYVQSPFEPGPLGAIVEATERSLGPAAWPVWNLSSHDTSRFSTRWCAGDPRKIRCALLLLFALRGTAILYYGDEIGMPDTAIPFEELRDPVGKRFWPASTGRDPSRTPMQWSTAAGAGFTEPGVTPWLRLGDAAACNVAAQRSDPRSILGFCRELIALRRASSALRSGAYAPYASPDGTIAWRRGDRHLVALNLADEAAVLDGFHGSIAFATERGRIGDAVGDSLRLGPWQGAIVESA